METLFYAQLKHKYLARAGARTWAGVEAALGEFMARTVKYIRGNKPRMTEIQQFKEKELDRGEMGIVRGEEREGREWGEGGTSSWLIDSVFAWANSISNQSKKRKSQKGKK